MENCFTQTVLTHVKECQQMFMQHQSDEYYIKRYLHDGLEEILLSTDDTPSEEDMQYIGLCDSHARDFCTFLREYKHINRQSVKYWLDF